MMGKKILIVDDEPITLQGLKKTLESWSNGNYEILAAPNAQTAIGILEQQTIHVLITDISMPEVTGLEMLKILKEQNHFPVVIIISAYSDFSYAQEAIEIGVVNYLLKPIKKQKLIEEVEKALQVEEKRYRSDMIEKVVDDSLVNIKSEEEHIGPIKKALDFIEENLEHPLTLKEVAAHVHLNSSYFSVLFKEHTNMKFSEYMTRSRIQKAKNLLLTTQLSVAEIAEAVGYTTSKYFIKTFKEYEGLTPSKYKKLK
ncbi:DNA-binding response regulator [Anaerobacillus arseniciselenatis]|uniref:DNA-binding response regulator n=1 Tax=Anaerobacillus arseniciselenatis TaxID=85682 RepID=A0A1S2LNG6_9BACI|nr:response regulator [Anaerobacillus arseniciselenatis]OIJ13874.1 DNA-binding response regulator [Anaerobacillus arseniciselenatis]